MKIIDVKQGSNEWMIARSAIPTASEFDNLLTPKFKVKDGKARQTYLEKKLAEWWQGGPLPGFTANATEQGTILEGEVVNWFELHEEVALNRVGFVTTDDGRIGCSPDGLIGEDSGAEIKAPAAHTHVGYLLGAELPDAYAVQVHGSMFVTGRPKWVFCSYRRHFPNLVLTVERDDVIQEQIAEALESFLESFEQGKARLIEINDGPPPRLKPMRPIRPIKPEPKSTEVATDDIGH
jgi:hypothetical protein